MKLIRYEDDFVVLVRGTQADAQALWDEVAAVLTADGVAPVGREDHGHAYRHRV